MKRLALLAAIAALVLAFFAFDLDRFLTLAELKQHQHAFMQWKAASPWLVGAIAFGLYVLVTMLSLPGALIMTLAMGALFDLALGTLLVSFASSIGATLAFLGARFLARDAVTRRFGDKLKAVNEGVARDGAHYLFTLRLVPVFPFFLINLLMGLTPMRASTFYWVSQAGMLPGTIVFVNAGTRLAELDSVAGIVSPAMLVSFALLGLFPFIARRISDAVRRRRVYARWRRPRRFDRNLIVIGAGAAGLVSAYIGAALKARVTLVEAHKMGGDCLNYGCVPSKALIKSARVARQMRDAAHYGLTAATPHYDFRNVMARVHEVVKAVEPHDSVARYTGLGVEVLEGHARIVDPWTVEVTPPGGRAGEPVRLSTRNIIIATGARPFVPALPGLAEVGYLTSDTLWAHLATLDALPKRMVVLGGGPIGCELAQSFARLGSHIIQVEMGERIMAREDQEVSALVCERLAADGVEVLTAHKAVRCERDGGEKFLVVEHAGGQRRIAFDELLCAVGRQARLSGFGLEELGIETARTVVTNEYLETLYPNIFAAGDVAGPYQFTHTAAHQAWYAAVNALFGDYKKFKADYAVIPWATFVDPEVARVGLNEQEAIAQHVAYEVSRYELDDLDRAIADGATRGFVKVLTVPGKDRILGVTIVGEHAADLLAEFVLAMKHGLGLNKILATIHTYPTMSEANKYAAGVWKKAHAPQRVLAWLARFHAWKRGGEA